MKVYCNNLECKLNKKLDVPAPFKPNKFYVSPFKNNDYYGECSFNGYGFVPIGISNSKCNIDIASCCILSPREESSCVCHRGDCASNVNKKCSKESIFVNKIEEPEQLFWRCMCYSQKKISGHIDWSRYPQQGGVSLTDDEAKKLDHDNRVTKMYPDHLRPAKERSKKPLMPPQIRYK